MAADFVIKRPYAPTPFWFWNDVLTNDELLRQMAAMDEAGVGGFVIHPRMGLPREQGWMSEALLGFMKVACEEAKRRGLRVVLYDEGMYPSGSSAGQVVEENPKFAVRAIEARLTEGLKEGETLLATGKRTAGPDAGKTVYFVDRPIPSVIRGLHYLDEAKGKEFTPPAADLLNPEAMQSFFRHVHEKYAAHLGSYFSAKGGPITGIFTDEPSLLGRAQIKGVIPGTTDILEHAKRLTGTDFGPLLTSVYFADEPGNKENRIAWNRAVRMRMEETYYAPMSKWCKAHGLELMGHPERPDDLGVERYFDVPGQDCVWRWNLPGKTATQGAQSVNPKCASSAAAHLGRSRNSNEMAGAYGHELTFEEFKWLADYLMVRGQNWIIPHAYYYSVRGPRFDERPPDVGLRSKWADQVGRFNRYCEQLCELLATSKQVVRVAILGSGDDLHWEAAEVLYQNQIDFNYLEDHLLETGAAKVDQSGVSIQGLHYNVLIYEGVGQLGDWAEPLKRGGHLIDAREAGWLGRVQMLVQRTLDVTPAVPGLRVRRMVREGQQYVLAFNEGETAIEVQLGTNAGVTKAKNLWTGQDVKIAPLVLQKFEAVLLE